MSHYTQYEINRLTIICIDFISFNLKKTIKNGFKNQHLKPFYSITKILKNNKQSFFILFQFEYYKI
ncbi:hypothetical protein BpHYR1_047990 [Brachionus plicatilis]|uniref:Uncharacterized protein n=1 Tax=Brachionus plicatilis TaxID=10195 RepID=A0A3M7QPD9_BRAPC|nr:hypothetical protein BpHYR1_047990 [Brachionus plicatilis]